MTSYSYVGVDPGTAGGRWAVISRHPSGRFIYGGGSFPRMSGGRVAPADLCEDLRFALGGVAATTYAAVEEIWRFPRLCVAYGLAAGMLLGLLPEGRVTLVPPQRWKKEFGLQGGAAGKEQAIELALQLHPGAVHLLQRLTKTGKVSRVLDHNMADALLIAEWMRRQHER